MSILEEVFLIVLRLLECSGPWDRGGKTDQSKRGLEVNWPVVFLLLVLVLVGLFLAWLHRVVAT